MCLMKRYYLFILSLLLPLFVFALSGKEHANDMKRIYPFVDCQRNEKIIDFYSLINNYLDSPNDRNTGRPDSIRYHPKFGKMKFGSHRIWYHWGFNTDPKRFAPLVNAVNSNIENGVISESDVDEFWNCLMNEVSRRNRFLMNRAAEIFGYKSIGSISQSQRSQLNAFVTILYSIHLLGDHQTTITDVMVDLKSVYGDIYNAIDNLAGRNRANILKARHIKKELRTVQHDPVIYLDKMEDSFSSFLLALDGSFYNYKEKFEKMGYVLK